MASSTVLLVVVIQVMAILSVLFIYASRYKKVAPDRAMVVYGRQMRPGIKVGYRVIMGGGKFILPIIEDVKFMDLGLKETVLELDGLRTDPRRGPTLLKIELTALYRISSEESGLHVASEHLLDKTPEEVRRITEVLIEGHMRGIVATRTAEDVDLLRNEVERIFMTQAAGDLLNIGIEIVTLRIIDVHIKGGS